MSCPVVLRWGCGCAGVLELECWLSPVDFARLDTTDHVKATISLLIFTTQQHPNHNLPSDSETGSTESVSNTDAMPRPADTIVPHSMSEHDRRFLLFLSLEAGM